MVNTHTLAIGALAILLSTQSLHGQDRSRYKARVANKAAFRP